MISTLDSKAAVARLAGGWSAVISALIVTLALAASSATASRASGAVASEIVGLVVVALEAATLDVAVLEIDESLTKLNGPSFVCRPSFGLEIMAGDAICGGKGTATAAFITVTCAGSGEATLLRSSFLVPVLVDVELLLESVFLSLEEYFAVAFSAEVNVSLKPGVAEDAGADLTPIVVELLEDVLSMRTRFL